MWHIDTLSTEVVVARQLDNLQSIFAALDSATAKGDKQTAAYLAMELQKTVMGLGAVIGVCTSPDHNHLSQNPHHHPVNLRTQSLLMQS